MPRPVLLPFRRAPLPALRAPLPRPASLRAPSAPKWAKRLGRLVLIRRPVLPVLPAAPPRAPPLPLQDSKNQNTK